jgi:hypothetical protein
MVKSFICRLIVEFILRKAQLKAQGPNPGQKLTGRNKVKTPSVPFMVKRGVEVKLPPVKVHERRTSTVAGSAWKIASEVRKALINENKGIA